jgi:RNA polymerase sigma factor (sigma-70 family)
MNINKVSDQELIDLYVDGNELALEILINRYKEYVFNYIISRVKDVHLSEDLFQDTFFKVINFIRSERYRDEGRFLAWVYRIAHNVISDYWRINNRMLIKENKDDFNVFDVIKSYDKSYEEIIVKEQISNDIRNLIEILPEEQREVVMMRHYSGMSFVEIAEETDENINTVLARMRYALRRLRKLIKKKELKLTY